MPYLLFLRNQQNLTLSSAANYGAALWVNSQNDYQKRKQYIP